MLAAASSIRSQWNWLLVRLSLQGGGGDAAQGQQMIYIHYDLSYRDKIAIGPAHSMED